MVRKGNRKKKKLPFSRLNRYRKSQRGRRKKEAGPA